MFQTLRKMFRSSSPMPVAPVAAVPDGERYYVVGDIHGRLDLFSELVAAIEADDGSAAAARTTIVLLGDLVDRGANSRGVIDLAREWQKRRNVRILAGNHEQMFLDSFDDEETLRHFLKHGGRETVLSYGVDRKVYASATLEELQDLMRRHVPATDLDYLRSFEECVVAGGYAFVHAGIQPGVPLAEQLRNDLLWIRGAFTNYQGEHEYVIVHGHTIAPDIDEQPNRIGIDTGAYRSGRLTALVLEGSTRRYIQAVERDDGTIAIEQRG